MRRPFSPLLADCQPIPFGDAGALERALSRRDAAAFLVEPIQIEGGLVFPPAGYLAAARDLCSRFGTLFVLDEVQTGFGRTGSMFAYQAESIVPDVLVLAKAAGGGLAPIGITVTTREIRHRAYGSMNRFDLHGSTFAGNAFACVAAAETLRILRDEALPENSRQRGAELLERLRSSLAGHRLVKDVRGRGLLVGVELGGAPLSDALSRNVLGQWLALALLERGVLCQPASQSWNVLRLEPPLTIGSAQIAEAADAVVAALHENRSLTPLLARVGRRVASQWASGGAFR
jgi:putrescine aminotransferase